MTTKRLDISDLPNLLMIFFIFHVVIRFEHNTYSKYLVHMIDNYCGQERSG